MSRNLELFHLRDAVIVICLRKVKR